MRSLERTIKNRKIHKIVRGRARRALDGKHGDARTPWLQPRFHWLALQLTDSRECLRQVSTLFLKLGKLLRFKNDSRSEGVLRIANTPCGLFRRGD
jgi:hypothetical protein